MTRTRRLSGSLVLIAQVIVSVPSGSDGVGVAVGVRVWVGVFVGVLVGVLVAV
jgi:hypothetical protein